MRTLLARVERLGRGLDADGAVGERPLPQREFDELGWLLGIVGLGLGLDLLGERRMRRGLDPVVGLLREALSDSDRSLAPHPAPLPDVGRAGDGGPRACWRIAESLWSAARALPPMNSGTSGTSGTSEHPLAWSLEPHADHFALRIGREHPTIVTIAAGALSFTEGTRA